MLESQEVDSDSGGGSELRMQAREDLEQTCRAGRITDPFGPVPGPWARQGCAVTAFACLGREKSSVVESMMILDGRR